MRVVVTRPQADALRWVQALAGHGIDAVALPLIEIRPLSDTRSVADAWQTSARCQAIMFVSAAAVDHFFAARPAQWGDPAQPGGPRLWATGPGTVAALVRHGVARDRIDAPAPDSPQFDSEALWRRVATQVRPPCQVMLVRGASSDVSLSSARLARTADDNRSDDQGQGRDWLATQLVQQGAQLHFAVAYWRAAPAAPALRQQIHDQGIGDAAVWLFTSGQAIAHLQACLPGHDWSGSRAIASHARIAGAARAAGFGVVRESRPALADMVASIKSLS
jgi:uroporphyrinogen-III synthase